MLASVIVRARGREPITLASNGEQPPRPARILPDGPAQGHNVIVHGTEHCVRIETTDFLNDVDTSNDLSPAPGQDFEHEDVVSGELQWAIGAGGGEASEVEPDALQADAVEAVELRYPVPPAQQGTHARQ